MLSKYMLNQIDMSENMTEFESAISILEFCQKQLLLDDIIYDGYFVEAGETSLAEVAKAGETRPTSPKKEGFFKRIGNAIKRAFDSIAKFFRNLFKGTESVETDVTQIADGLSQAKQQGKTAEQLLEEAKASSTTPATTATTSPSDAKEKARSIAELIKNISRAFPKVSEEEAEDDLLHLMKFWMQDPNAKPTMLSKESASAMKALISSFKQLSSLTKGNVNTLKMQGGKVLDTINKQSKKLSKTLANQSSGIASTNGTNNEEKMRIYFYKNGVPIDTSNKILGEFSKVLDQLKDDIAIAMDDPTRAKAFESFNNVSDTLKEAMTAGKLIKFNIDYFTALTPAVKAAVKKDVGLKINAKMAGKKLLPGKKGKHFEIYDVNGPSEHAQKGRAAGKHVFDNVEQHLHGVGVDDARAKRYADLGDKMARRRYQRNVEDAFKH